MTKEEKKELKIVAFTAVASLSVMAIGASIKSYADVAVLKSEQKTNKELLTEVRDDVKTLLIKLK